MASALAPQMEALKYAYFHHHPDEPLILHRKELVNKRYPFNALLDPAIEANFNRDLLDLLDSWQYTAITVVIDKQQHKLRYKVWRYNPYHYCLEVLVERFVLWLKANDHVGDVMTESRGGREDRRLKNTFATIYKNGTSYIKPEQFHAQLTSCELKVKSKQNNIAGLQLADLIAHPSFKAAHATMNHQPIPNNFGGQIARILERSKYHRGPKGVIDEWGRKWLP